MPSDRQTGIDEIVAEVAKLLSSTMAAMDRFG
jgi:hypothetical protein